MGDTTAGGLTSGLACEVCGRLPHPCKQGSPGITPELAAVRAIILDQQVHPVAEGAPDEIVVGAAEHVREEDLLGAIQRGGGVDVHLWPTTALALVDGQTKALTQAARVALTPESRSSPRQPRRPHPRVVRAEPRDPPIEGEGRLKCPVSPREQ